MKRNNIKVAVGLGLAQLAFFYAPAFAQAQKPSSLNEVVVTATRSPKKQAEIGKVVRVISSEEISRSQGRTLPELLNTVAGINIAGSGSNLGDIKSVFLRGASSGNTLLLMDGIALNDASGITGEYNIAAISIDQIERIEILKGGNSTLYGSDAVAGVINIITKKASGKLQGNILQTAGSYNTFKQGAGIAGTINKTDISLNVSNLNTKGFSNAQSPLINTKEFEKDGFNQKSLGFNVNHQITNKWTMLALVNYNINTSDLDGGAFTDVKDYQYDKTAYLINIGSRISFNKSLLRFNFSQNNVRNKFDNQGSITDNKGNISNAEALYTAEVNNYIGITSGFNYKLSRTNQTSDFGSLSSDTASNSIASIFTSLFFKGGKYFRLELGGRINKHNQFGNNFNYTFNPSFMISQHAKLFFNASSAFRVPSLYQLTSEYRNPSGLKPETSTTFETGFDVGFLDNKVTFNAALYQRKIKDVIFFGLQELGGFGYLNQSQENTRGLEIEAGTTLIKNLNFSGFYAYTNGKSKENDASDEVWGLSRRPKTTFGASAGFEFNKKMYVSLLYKYTGVRSDRYNEFDGNNFKTIIVDLNVYHKIDAYIQYKPINKLTLFADVKNLFDAKYNDFVGYNTMAINFNAGLSLNFN